MTETLQPTHSALILASRMTRPYSSYSLRRKAPNVSRSAKEQHVTVGGRTCDHFSANIAASAGTVLDDELLAESFGQPLTDQACRCVRSRASCEADDDAHRPRRISLRSYNRRYGRQNGSTRCQMEKLSSAGRFHHFPVLRNSPVNVGRPSAPKLKKRDAAAISGPPAAGSLRMAR
jgi:hypothetical protein